MGSTSCREQCLSKYHGLNINTVGIAVQRNEETGETIVIHRSRYSQGRKYCSKCAVYFTPGNYSKTCFCLCCGTKLRSSPRQSAKYRRQWKKMNKIKERERRML